MIDKLFIRIQPEISISHENGAMVGVWSTVKVNDIDSFLLIFW
jgi:hypothetical protein